METLAGFWDSNPAGIEFMKDLRCGFAVDEKEKTPRANVTNLSQFFLWLFAPN
jgi:hypothetical protein